jgi:hypothetical protein
MVLRLAAAGVKADRENDFANMQAGVETIDASVNLKRFGQLPRGRQPVRRTARPFGRTGLYLFELEDGKPNVCQLFTKLGQNVWKVQLCVIEQV